MLRTGDGYWLIYSGNWGNQAAYGIGFARCAGATGPCEKPFDGRCNGIAHDGTHLWALDAKAQRICGEHQKIVAKLAEKYREKPEAMGVAADGSLLQVMVSPKGGWTILVTSPKRVTLPKP